jgi:3-deoxy-7-phosphoheptulonate synthase
MHTKYKTDDLRICEIREVIAPNQVHDEMPISEQAAKTTLEARQAVHKILTGEDDRLLVVVGPCSIHDTQAALEYAQRLKQAKDDLAGDLLIIMRVYFEKPRTTVGWKGLINDPDIDSSFNINKGLRVARQLLIDVNNLGMPAATEYLDLITPQYVSDLIAWGAIGARTTESQGHRELASGVSCPIGFKNSTDGTAKIHRCHRLCDEPASFLVTDQSRSLSDFFHHRQSGRTHYFTWWQRRTKLRCGQRRKSCTKLRQRPAKSQHHD